MYVRIYAALLACLVIAATLFAMIHLLVEPARHVHGFAGVDAGSRAQMLPPAAPREEIQRVLTRWRGELQADLALYGADGRQANPCRALIPGCAAAACCRHFRPYLPFTCPTAAGWSRRRCTATAQPPPCWCCS
jgi:hypothetical protein